MEHGGSQETFAYLDDELIESKISDEMRDHPLLAAAAREGVAI
jgi:hypothetical protein